MIITRGYFSDFRVADSSQILNEAHTRTRMFSSTGIRSGAGNTVFISHKHDDLDEIQGFITYLEKEYHVTTYIDSMDKGMPMNTCAGTAERIKQVIGNSNKFILLATNNALSSKWCNWEVGIADKTKLPVNNMAILPMLDRGQSLYHGNEYLEIYPYIEERVNIFNGNKYLAVNIHTKDGRRVVSLKGWLNNNTNL